MKYIVFDLEATCWENKEQRPVIPGIGKAPMEIIEIGAVCVDEEGQVCSEFSEFIHPVIVPTLSDFCKKLTSITQEDVDNAWPFKVVIRKFAWWIMQNLRDPEEEAVLCSWGHYDKKQLTQDIKYHKEDELLVLLQGHFSIKHQHGALVNKKPMGMAQALQLENLELTGTHHRGIDDARNIVKIFNKYLGKWKVSDE